MNEKINGKVIWFVGLSGAGKTTISKAVGKKLLWLGYRVEILDGDRIRDRSEKKLGFTKEGREENIKRICGMAKRLSEEGAVVLVAAITPYESMRQDIRSEISDYFEVYVKTSIEACEARDVKGLYKKARLGEITCFTGITDPFEAPESSHLVCATENRSVGSCAEQIISSLLN